MKIRKRRQPVNFESLTDDETVENARSDGLQPLEEPAAERPPEAELPAAPPPSQSRFSPMGAVQGAAPQNPAPEPPPEPAHLSPTEPRALAPRQEAQDAAAPAQSPEPADGPPPAWPIYVTALVVSALWALAPVAFAWGYRGEVVPFRDDAFALAVFVLLAVGPAAFVWVGAYLVRQGQLLAAEARRARDLAEEMVTPAVLAAGQTGALVQSVREEIGRASQVAEEAHQMLLALREALATESERLTQAAGAASRTAHGLSDSLGRERTEMAALGQRLDQQASAVADAITRQAKMVAEASDLAEAQLREAEASLAARAADMAAAAGEAGDTARLAGEDLTRHIARLEGAGAGVADQIRAVEAGLSEQRAGLVTVVHGLRADQEAFAAQAETQAAKLSEFLSETRQSASQIGEQASAGAEAVRRLIGEAATQFRDLAEAAEAERRAFGAAARETLGAVSEAAAEERAKLEAQTRAAIEALAKAAEETRAAAARHAEAAREQVDQLSEAAFSAGQKADQAFEARLTDARRLIEQSAQLVEDAGAATARKLDEGAAAARGTLEELQRMLGEIEERAAQLPNSALRQAQEVRSAVSDSIDELMAQARRAAEETQAIDTAFQERVRRNYEMLSEAVRLMGSVAGGSAAAPEPPARRSPPAEPPVQAAAPAPPQPEVPTSASEAVSAKQDLGLRPRLRLTPTATDEEFSSVFDSAGGRTEPVGDGAEGWTWKELLSSIDETGSGEAATRLEDVLAGEIAGMGIDPAALLPRTRIEELAAVLQAGEFDGAREVVRKLAPAAMRRLTRRLFTDAELRGQAAQHTSRYEAMLEEAAEQDPSGRQVAEILATEGGRTYLLLDAAGGGLE